MARFTAWLRRSPHPRHRFGAIRLAVVGLMLASVVVLLLAAFRRHPAAASTARSLATSSPSKDCGCGTSASVAGVRVHYAPTSGGKSRLAQSVGGEDSGADVIIPDSARWDSWVLTPGDRRVLATTAPLVTEGKWSALYGAVDDNGDGTVTYTAPSDVPPQGLDEIYYSSDQPGPTIQLMVSVRGGGQGEMAARGRRPASRLAASVVAPVTECTAQPVELASLPLLRHIPGGVRGDYAQTVRWIEGERGTGRPTLRLAQGTTADGGGYVLPAWVDDDSVGVYTPAASPDLRIKYPPPIICKTPGPVNPYPPYPPGGYYCTPGVPYDVASGWSTASAYMTGVKTVGNWTGYVTGEVQADALRIYSAKLDVGMQTQMHVTYQNRVYRRVQTTDHYKCADNGRNWIYLGSTLCDQQGQGTLYKPEWLSLVEGCPPHGDPEWFQPSCRPIHVQPTYPPG